MKFVKSMNDSFESIRSKILTTTPLPNINTAFNIATTHERKQSCNSGQPKVMMIQRNGRVNTQTLLPGFHNQSRGNVPIAKHNINVGINTDNSMVPMQMLSM